MSTWVRFTDARDQMDMLIDLDLVARVWEGKKPNVTLMDYDEFGIIPVVGNFAKIVDDYFDHHDEHVKRKKPATKSKMTGSVNPRALVLVKSTS